MPVALVGVGPGREQVIWTATTAATGPLPLPAAAAAAPAQAPLSDQHRRERDLHAHDAALGPVDVVELEQQRRLVERQRDAGAERERQPRRRARSLRGATATPPARNAMHDAGDEVVDVAVRTRTVAKRAARAAAADRARRQPRERRR